MFDQYNPFKENRAEQMKDLWRYYVPFPGLDETGKPVMVLGGRGSGKTMFFQCNSWRQVLSQIKKEGGDISRLFNEKKFIGIYYRVDTSFVSAMSEKEETNWNAIFETYFSICIILEILDLLIEISQDMPLSNSHLLTFISTFSKKFSEDSVSDSLEKFRAELDNYLDFIEDIINGTSLTRQYNLRYVNAFRLIFDICSECNKLLKKEIIFKIFVDEYETLQEYQQRIINTFIKHSSLPVIFNIGLRPHGIKTKQTISRTETIEPPHDYEVISLGIYSDTYLNILKDICKKRIELGKEKGKIPANASEDINDYLGNYSVDDELAKIQKNVNNFPHIIKLRALIQQLGQEQRVTQEQIDIYIKNLCDNVSFFTSRLHYALLCRKTQYTPTLKELNEEFSKRTDRYKEWTHNRKIGVIFLLCKELKKEKMYYGFEVFAALSSNIVRYFLELCEQAFRLAFLDDYQWDGPIPFEIQTEAAKYVSEYKILDIASYEPDGKKLRIFTQYLGHIFYKLHTDDLNTLGEPEPNHFSTKDLSLPVVIKTLIDSAIMWNVLQEGEPTKRKQSKLSPETVDYYLTKIYVPYFGISYRNQRKIELTVKILEELFSGDDEKAKKAVRNYFKPSTISDNKMQNELFDFEDEE